MYYIIPQPYNYKLWIIYKGKENEVKWESVAQEPGIIWGRLDVAWINVSWDEMRWYTACKGQGGGG